VDASLVLKQDQAEEFQIVFNTYTGRKHNPTSTLQTSTIFNRYGPIGGHFAGLLVAIETRTASVNGLKPPKLVLDFQTVTTCLLIGFGTKGPCHMNSIYKTSFSSTQNSSSFQ
jgi:hypothetical protein